MSEIIKAVSICKSFKGVNAVDDVSLQVGEGEIYGLVGADGAGKTTTIRLLCGALKLDSGNITVAGFDITREADKARQQIGYLSQRFSLYEDLTVLENIRFFAEVRGLKSDEWYPRCMEILHFVGLADFKDRFAGQLSGGMKQKLGLASALVVKPKVFLFDEPTTGVDPVTRQDFWQLIISLVNHQNDLNREKVAVLVSTPYMDEAARCHRIGFMHHGRIIAEGTPGELRSILTGRILELVGHPLPFLKNAVRNLPLVDDAHAFGDSLHIRLKDQAKPEHLNNIKKSLIDMGGKVDLVRVIPPGLEDVFIALAGQEPQNSGENQNV
jgi:ABC-2 type transport system ATP-binding protein